MTTPDIIGSCMLKGKVVRFINKNPFTINDREFLIIGTEKTGKEIYEAVDYVKNDRGEIRRFDRLKLLEFIKTETT